MAEGHEIPSLYTSFLRDYSKFIYLLLESDMNDLSQFIYIMRFSFVHRDKSLSLSLRWEVIK